MDKVFNSANAPVHPRSWCVEWFGSQGDEGEYSLELHESVEIVGFYSRGHRGVFTPRDSNFHMHVRTLDNRLSRHLEAFHSSQGMTVYVPGK